MVLKIRIESIHAREVLDSRGRPTVEVEVDLEGGRGARAIVPSGASTGRHEALELRDGDKKRHNGLGVRRAVANVNETLGPELMGANALDQPAIDERLIALDGSADKSRLGANAILGVSLAVARAAADALGLPLWRYLGGASALVMPLPMVNIISGNLHAAKNLDFQDFLIMPVGAKSYTESLEMSVNVFQATEEILRERELTTMKADEGGFGPALPDNKAALELVIEAIERAGYRPGPEVAIALDVASTHFYDRKDDKYHLRAESRSLGRAEFIELLSQWVDQYPIVSIEDGLAEDDWDGAKELTARLGRQVQVLGDDLFTTNRARLQKGIEMGAANAILIKMNQIGTLTETFAAIELARRAGYRPVISTRSGETEDDSLSDIAVASGAGQVKNGSLSRSERLCKYNQLLRIEEALGKQAIFPGPRF